MTDVNLTNAADVARVTRDLLKPFADDEVKIKPAKVSGGRALGLHYIDSRCVMDRLDEVVGVNGWRDEYTVLASGEVECRLSLRIAGEWITKADVGGQSEQPDEGDRMKAAYSDALKRAAVKFGVGRFLYRIPQQWYDYDPAKKQIVRPAARPQPQPAAGDNTVYRTLCGMLDAAADPDHLRAAGEELRRQRAKLNQQQFDDLIGRGDAAKKRLGLAATK